MSNEIIYTLLGLFFQVLPFVVVMVLALAICIFVVGAYSSPVFGVWAGAVVFVISQSGGNIALPLGVFLTVEDMCFLMLGFVVAVRLMLGHLPAKDLVVRLWLLMTVVWGGLFVVGLVQYKSAAGVEFRSTFYMVVPVLYLMSFRLSSEQVGKIFMAFYFIALALVLLAIYRWGAYAIGETGDWFDRHAPLRVLNAAGAMLIAMAMLPGSAMWIKLNAQRQAMMYTVPVLLLVVMVLAHRTVWISTLAALGFAWWLAGSRRKGGQAGLLVPLLVGALVLGALFALAPKSVVTQEFERSVAETQKKNSTIAWRMDSWKALVEDWAAAGPLVWLVGKPFGSGNQRFIESQGQETKVQAHSHYVSLLTRGGLLVLFSYVVVQVVTVRRLLRGRVETPDWLGGEILALFIVATMVYAIGYGIGSMQAYFMGLAYSLVVQAVPHPSVVRSATAKFVLR
ncbi:MAG: hypothetical protein KKH12_08675 [Gammaproteobacteria bacterium]|nr:hypothetical protein [Gammaproteobacteria bacterium]MBU1481738.1 hypothetical protein [Gammaproteobacteria bacterium]